MSVEKIINTFQKELEKDALFYIKEAERVAKYDSVLRQSERAITDLTVQTQRCLVHEKEIDSTIQSVATLQEEVEKNLASIEKQVDELFEKQADYSQIEADVERERAYTTAAQLEADIQMLLESLEATMQDLKSAQETTLSGDAGYIVKILNDHRNTLADLDTASRRLDRDVEQANQLLGQHFSNAMY